MISPQYLNKIRIAVAEIFGWDFGEDRLQDLERGLLETARELGIGPSENEIERWIATISWTGKELSLLSTHLTIGETYFFREKPWLHIFQEEIIPELIQNRKGKDQSIRIWSAGCCSGEEPYSLAMLLTETIPDIQKWDITILGTDINPLFLSKANKGVYTAWSFRETSHHRKTRFFSNVNGTMQINPQIKNMVSFKNLNLAHDNYPSAVTNTQGMDIIFCRNVLMYFTPEQIRNVVGRLHSSLNENGWLIVSAVELNNDYFTQFNPVRINACTLYRKPGRQARKCIDHRDPAHSEKKCSFIPGASKQGTRQFPFSVKLHYPLSKKAREEVNVAQANGAYLYNQGQYEQSASVCEKIVRKAQDNIEVRSLLIRSKANLGLFQEAEKWTRSLAMLPNVNADHFYEIASTFFEKNEFRFAEAVLKKALYLDPHHLMSHFLSGKLANRPETKPAAIKHFQNVRELLTGCEDEFLVPGTDGLTAGKIRELITNII
jgi:chemotaxis protein methyltransferase CheR